MPLPTDLEKAEEAKRRANERSTHEFDLIGILCPACNEPVTYCEPNPNEYVTDETGEYGNDRAAFEYSPKRLQNANANNPFDLVHVVPERTGMVDGSHQLQVIAYKHDHSTEAYTAWKKQLDLIEQQERRAEENHGLDAFDEDLDDGEVEDAD